MLIRMKDMMDTKAQMALPERDMRLMAHGNMFCRGNTRFRTRKTGFLIRNRYGS
jgi:hypothetical protein